MNDGSCIKWTANIGFKMQLWAMQFLLKSI